MLQGLESGKLWSGHHGIEEDSQAFETARTRLARVWSFLREFRQLGRPPRLNLSEYPWRMRLRGLPSDPSISLTPDDEEALLTVRRPRLTPCPALPDELVDWLEPGWDRFEPTPSPRGSRNRFEEGETVTERFEDSPLRREAWNFWMERRQAWQDAERPVRAALEVFERLFELHSQLERESGNLSLCLGDGILSWRGPRGPIEHPLLVQALELEFQPQVPRFVVRPADREPELYTPAIREAQDADAAAISNLRVELEEGGFQPLGWDAATFLKGLVQRLFAQGRFLEGPETIPQGVPSVRQEPVLFLTQRGQGFEDSVSAFLQSLSTCRTLPPALANIVGVELASSFSSAPREPDPGELLFTHPANPEQREVAQRLAETGCVLVQGPPGTGKTHTIANLIGHLLAKGQSVLVTSHTSKALRVLRDKVAEELRPLCVSVLDDDRESRKQLEAAIQTIASRLGLSDPHTLKKEVDLLGLRRAELQSRLEATCQKLAEAHRREYEHVVVAGESILPAEAARHLASWKGVHDWIPGPVEEGSALPLSPSEIAELYRTNSTLPAQDERAMADRLPRLLDLPSPGRFQEIVERLTRLEASDRDFAGHIFSLDEENPEQLEELARAAQAAVAQIRVDENWQMECVASGIHEEDAQTWRSLLDLIDETNRGVAQRTERVLQLAPETSLGLPLSEQLAICSELLARVEARGNLNWAALLFQPKWKRFLQGVRVSGRQPATLEELQALEDHLRIIEMRNRLRERWHRQMVAHGAPGLGDRPEREARVFIERIEAALNWRPRTWAAVILKMKGCGITWRLVEEATDPDPHPHGELLRIRRAVETVLLPALESRVLKLEHRRVSRMVDDVLGILAQYPESDAEGLVGRLRVALETRNSETFAQAWQRLAHLEEQTSLLERRWTLLQRLAGSAPGWADAIERRILPHHEAAPPNSEFRKAWNFRQWHQTLARRNRIRLADLQTEVNTLQDELRRITARFIEVRTWKAQMQRTGIQERQALIGWADLMRKIGKGTGKRVPQLRAQARRQLASCRTAVPVWIMPLSRVFESFTPGTTPFDVLILDEASQSDLTGLAAFALAKRILVVGDHMQVSPAAVGQEIQIVENLIGEHLHEIPNRVLYDGKSSVYDLARQSFGGTIRLREHFRSVPEIIRFSNALCYGGEMLPLREPLESISPPTVAWRVPHGRRVGKVNEEEARHLVSLLVACTRHPAYARKTFGVISLLGDDQTRLVQNILRERLDPEEYARRRIVCGNSAQFQGDERDIMFLSMVDSPDSGPLRLMARDDSVQRYNVAASRARDQMWVLHSVNPAVDLKPDDLRRTLLEYCASASGQELAQREAAESTESVFEKLVCERLLRAGHRVHPQLPVGVYRVDLVVEGASGRVAIECDGDQYHPPEQLEKDLARQALLERVANLRFIRIRGSEYFQDPEGVMAEVLGRLEALGIQPLGPETDGTVPDDGEGLRQEIARVADSLRREWWPPEEPSAATPGIPDWEPLLSRLSEFPELIVELEHELRAGLRVPIVRCLGQHLALVDPATPGVQEACELDLLETLALDPRQVHYGVEAVQQFFGLSGQPDAPQSSPPTVPFAPERVAPPEAPCPEPGPAPETADVTYALVHLLMNVAKADGVILDEETKAIVDFFRDRLAYQDCRLDQVCSLIDAARNQPPDPRVLSESLRPLEPAARELLVQTATEVACADGEFHPQERQVIQQMCLLLDVPISQIEAIVAEFQEPTAEGLLEVLDLPPMASPSEVERQMACLRERFDPVVMGRLGEDFEQLARRRLDRLESAYARLNALPDFWDEAPDPEAPTALCPWCAGEIPTSGSQIPEFSTCHLCRGALLWNPTAETHEPAACCAHCQAPQEGKHTGWIHCESCGESFFWTSPKRQVRTASCQEAEAPRDLEILERLSPWTRKCLEGNGLETVGKVLSKTRSELLEIHGFGSGCWWDLYKQLRRTVPFGHPWRERVETLTTLKHGNEERDRQSRDEFVRLFQRSGGQSLLELVSTRTRNSLVRSGLDTVGKVLSKTRFELLQIRNFGSSCWQDLCDQLMMVVPPGHPWRNRVETMATLGEEDRARDEQSREAFLRLCQGQPEATPETKGTNPCPFCQSPQGMAGRGWLRCDACNREFHRETKAPIESASAGVPTQTMDPGAVSIHQMGLSTRLRNCLVRGRADTVGKILCLTRAEMMEIRNFGIGCWQEICQALPRWVPDRHPWSDRVKTMVNLGDEDQEWDRLSRARFVQQFHGLPQSLEKLETATTNRHAFAPRPLGTGTDPEQEQDKREPAPPETTRAPKPPPPDTPEAILEQVREALWSPGYGQPPDRRWSILMDRLGLDGRPPKTLAEIGEILNLTRERIRQLESKALKILTRQQGLRRVWGWLREARSLRLGFATTDELVDELGWSDSREPGRVVLALVALTTHNVELAPDEDLFFSNTVLVEQLRRLHTKAMTALPRQVGSHEIAEFLSRHLGENLPDRDAERIAQLLWGVTVTDTPQGRLFHLAPQAAFFHADAAETILRAEGRPLQLEEFRTLFQKYFPGREISHQSLGNVLGADERFFLVRMGTWALTETIPTTDPEVQSWKETLLKRLWSLGQVTNTRLLLGHLGDQVQLPEWLNEFSLYWLLRRDPRFRTHRRLEVSPADADWQRVDLREDLKEILRTSAGPLHETEIEERLSVRRPMPRFSIGMCLARGEEDGTFFRLSGSTWTLPQNLELPEFHAARLRAQALEHIKGTQTRVNCRETSWRPGLEHLPTERVDYALSQESRLFRCAYGVYADATQEADWGSLTEAMTRILIQADKPLTTSELRERLDAQGRPVAPATSYAAVRRCDDLVRYPYGYRALVGLQEWGLKGYMNAATADWESVRRSVLDAAGSDEELPYEGLAMAAVWAVAERAGDREVLEALREEPEWPDSETT